MPKVREHWRLQQQLQTLRHPRPTNGSTKGQPQEVPGGLLRSLQGQWRPGFSVRGLSTRFLFPPPHPIDPSSSLPAIKIGRHLPPAPPKPILTDPNPPLTFLEGENRGLLKKRAAREWDQAKEKESRELKESRSKSSAPKMATSVQVADLILSESRGTHLYILSPA